jgi:3'(2'), 5'-bisphosphate nucleotidase
LWRKYWLVDPLDGTEEFVRHGKDFTVNIALIGNGRPFFGIVYVPVTRVAYMGGLGLAAFKCEHGKCAAISSRRMAKALTAGTAIDVVVSMHHEDSATNQLIAELRRQYVLTSLSKISSSLKFFYWPMAVQIYIHD